MTEIPQDIQNLSFEDAMTELENVVRRLESGRIKLDEAVSTYERGVLLKKFCEEKLASAKSKIDKLVIDKNTGMPIGTESFDEHLNS